MQHVRDIYHDRLPRLDAIVGPDTNGNVLAVAVAQKLKLPYFALQRVGKFDADPDDVIRRTYKDRNDKVKLEDTVALGWHMHLMIS